jgi:hypothetical protein
MLNSWIPLEDMNFLWSIADVETVIEAYKSKMFIGKIAKIVKRPIDEVAILIMDLGRKRII